VPVERGDADGEAAGACGWSSRADLPMLVARRGCVAVARPAKPARSGEPGRRRGNASVIKGTRETWSQQLVAAGDTSAKPDPGIAKPAPASPASRSLAPCRRCPPGRPGRAGMAGTLRPGLCLPAAPSGCRATSGRWHGGEGCQLCPPAPLAPKHASRGLRDAFLALLGPRAGH